ncbi:hypothetical protein BI344_17800 [Chromobacterium sphagni]|uniref:YqaJ viral recombinase domain-containing protein n=2 Tax=Chromobacterium sphagni TaxID=1903179 RepID=A0ABX3CBQ8_9NEIS|nr:hypothetical protein BI344_17800 [Chromobacterium sphagni]
MSREEWLALRNTGIGGSDAGTVLGINPYKTAYQLYLEKRGEIAADDTLPSTLHAERHNKGQSFSPAHWPRMRSSSENN